MAQAKENFAAGDKLDDSGANDINQFSKNANDAGGFRDDINSGETINGGTLPVAVYQDPADNELYACDGNVTTKLEFIGFAISNSTDGNPIDFQGSGLVRGFTGLTEGTKYYVQDDKTIGTAKGTYPVLVGIAVTETELLIMNDKKNLGPWSSALTIDTVYQAPQDGFVVVYITAPAGANSLRIDGRTDGNNPPTTIRTAAFVGVEGTNAAESGLCMPVKEGDYWKITTLATVGAPTEDIYWMPLSK